LLIPAHGHLLLEFGRDTAPLEDAVERKKTRSSGHQESGIRFGHLVVTFATTSSPLASGTLGVRPRLPDPNHFRPLLMPIIILPEQHRIFKKNSILFRIRYSVPLIAVV